MKNIIVILFVLFAFESYSQNSDHEIKWMNLDQAQKLNQENPKKIFIDVYTSWCGWCKRMESTTFKDSAVIAYMNSHYYAVKLDAETKDSLHLNTKSYGYKAEYKSNELAATLLNGQMSYPTSVYLDEHLNEIAPVPGYLDQEQLLKVLRYFGDDLYKSESWNDYVSKNFN